MQRFQKVRSKIQSSCLWTKRKLSLRKFMTKENFEDGNDHSQESRATRKAQRFLKKHWKRIGSSVIVALATATILKHPAIRLSQMALKYKLKSIIEGASISSQVSRSQADLTSAKNTTVESVQSKIKNINWKPILVFAGFIVVTLVTQQIKFESNLINEVRQAKTHNKLTDQASQALEELESSTKRPSEFQWIKTQLRPCEAIVYIITRTVFLWFTSFPPYSLVPSIGGVYFEPGGGPCIIAPGITNRDVYNQMRFYLAEISRLGHQRDYPNCNWCRQLVKFLGETDPRYDGSLISI